MVKLEHFTGNYELLNNGDTYVLIKRTMGINTESGKFIDITIELSDVEQTRLEDLMKGIFFRGLKMHQAVYEERETL